MPILASALRRSDAGESFPSLEEIRNEVGLDVPQMRAGLSALRDALPPYMEFTMHMAGPNVTHGFVTSIGERTRRELGSWPSSNALLEDIVLALEKEAETTVEPEAKSRIKSAADVVSGIARDVLVAALAARVGSI
jgi:hypothetical protein